MKTVRVIDILRIKMLKGFGHFFFIDNKPSCSMNQVFSRVVVSDRLGLKKYEVFEGRVRQQIDRSAGATARYA